MVNRHGVLVKCRADNVISQDFAAVPIINNNNNKKKEGFHLQGYVAVMRAH